MKCWYCDKETMEDAPELGSGWSKCSSCGATHNPPFPVFAASPLGATWKDEQGFRHYHSVKPRKRKKA